MVKGRGLVIIVAVALVLCSGCATPTPTPVPPTATPIPPTATPVPPTETPSPTATITNTPLPTATSTLTLTPTPAVSNEDKAAFRLAWLNASLVVNSLTDSIAQFRAGQKLTAMNRTILVIGPRASRQVLTEKVEWTPLTESFRDRMLAEIEPCLEVFENDIADYGKAADDLEKHKEALIQIRADMEKYVPIAELEPPTPTPTATDDPTLAPKLGSRRNPIPLGESATLVRDDGTTFVGHIKEVIWDQAKVKNKLTTDNMFNGVPSAGYEGVFIYFVCEYTKGSEDKPASISHSYFDYLCGDGQFYGEPSEVVVDELAGQGFPGATFEGWIYRGGAVSDKPDLLVWKASWLGSATGDGIWFALE